MLHVVFAPESAAPTIRGDGVPIATVALRPLLAAPLEELLEEWEAGTGASDPLPCRTPAEAKAVLERAGMARFAAKAARFEADFTCVDPPQALWTALFEALGYSANVRPFRRLADRVGPLDVDDGQVRILPLQIEPGQRVIDPRLDEDPAKRADGMSVGVALGR